MGDGRLVDLLFVLDPVQFSPETLLFTPIGAKVEVAKYVDTIDVRLLARGRPQ